MKQLTAKNPLSGQKIIQRYIEGVRYMKITPKMIVPVVVSQLRKQFDGKPINIEESETGWIKIMQTGEDEQVNKVKEQLKKESGNAEINEDYVLNKEAEMLKQQGFQVKIEVIE